MKSDILGDPSRKRWQQRLGNDIADSIRRTALSVSAALCGSTAGSSLWLLPTGECAPWAFSMDGECSKVATHDRSAKGQSERQSLGCSSA